MPGNSLKKREGFRRMKSIKNSLAELEVAAGPGAPRSKADRAYAFIRQRVLDGQRTPGERLVIEHLAREMDVSVVPVREAIRRLEAEGYVTYTRNVGATVTSIDLDRYPETVEALAVLEGVAIGLAAPHITAKDIKAARALNEQICAATSTRWIPSSSLRPTSGSTRSSTGVARIGTCSPWS